MVRLVAWLACGCCTVAVGCKRTPPPKSNIVLIMLDTTRADRLGSYGYGKPTTPHLDRLAEESVRYTRAFSTSSWTLPATASLFTSLYPSSHGAHFVKDGAMAVTSAIRGSSAWNRVRANGLSRELPTLAHALTDLGYDTCAVVGGPWLKRVFGVDRGFAHYDEDGIININGRPGTDITARALAWVDQHRERPFFLFLNYYEPHWPYEPPGGSLFVVSGGVRPKDEDGLVRLKYDGEVRTMDRAVGALLDGLRERGLFDGAWVVALGDHGELLGEHEEWGHGVLLTHEEIHIPLLVKRPGGSRGRDDQPVQIVDLAPTLLVGVGGRVPEPFQGEPFDRVRHPIVAEVYPPEHMSDGAWRAIIEGDEKYGWNSQGDHQLVELPAEAENLLGARPQRAAEMRRRMEEFLAGLAEPPPPPPPPEVDDETLQLLRTLGYQIPD